MGSVLFLYPNSLSSAQGCYSRVRCAPREPHCGLFPLLGAAYHRVRCTPRGPHCGLFPLHGAAHKNAVCQATLAGGISMPGGHPLYRLSTIHFKNSFLQILTYPVLSLLPAAPDSLILSRCLLLRYISSLEFPFQIPSSLMS